MRGDTGTMARSVTLFHYLSMPVLGCGAWRRCFIKGDSREIGVAKVVNVGSSSVGRAKWASDHHLMPGDATTGR